jgi:hypothetical protein
VHEVQRTLRKETQMATKSSKKQLKKGKKLEATKSLTFFKIQPANHNPSKTGN